MLISCKINDTVIEYVDPEEQSFSMIATKPKDIITSTGHIINKYTKLDPTLPRINTILCPNPNCTTNTDDTPREIIYIRYDDTNMKYVYLCSTCDTVWKPEDNK